tara:strand:- start:17457 stop:17864 length:408 start_codon:yes stop_codon:yes gene_type:complete
MNDLVANFELDKESGSVSLSMLPFMHTGVVLMIAWTNAWCDQRGIKPVWTSWIRTEMQNARLNGTKVHVEGRGADLSLKFQYGWNEFYVNEFEADFNAEFEEIGAFAWKDDELVSRPLVLHDSGHGYHAHLQSRP